mmetsp:Transcript_20706/g.42526  ORF Transcript_20706/g.42526 Transcript_20706/m.42526 type:complete len:80 (-) Transcript_20706:3412-3651(-)
MQVERYCERSRYMAIISAREVHDDIFILDTFFVTLQLPLIFRQINSSRHETSLINEYCLRKVISRISYPTKQIKIKCSD